VFLPLFSPGMLRILAFVSISLHRALSASPVLAAVRIRNSSAHADAAGRLASRHMAWQRGEQPSWPCWVSPGGDRGARASAPGSRRRGCLTRSGLDPVDPQRTRTPRGDPALHASLCRGKPIDFTSYVDTPAGILSRHLMANWPGGLEAFWISEETKIPETAH
jgi:hypothetical protein